MLDKTGDAEQISSTYADTLLQISPLPKAVIVPGARKRKSTGSEVITSSPYKKALTEKQQEKIQKTKGKGMTAAGKSAKTQNPGNTVRAQKNSSKVPAKKHCRKTADNREPGQHVTVPVKMADKSISSNAVSLDAADTRHGSPNMESTTLQVQGKPKRVRKQRFSLAEAVRAIVADSDNSDSDVEL